MKKSKIIVGALSMMMVVALIAGCGSSEKQTASQPPASQQTSGHEGMNMSGHENMSMPKGDPMPMMKDMDKGLQDVVKQVKDGKTMDAQKTAIQLVSTTEKVMPHMMDAELKEKLSKAVAELKDSVNSGKIDPAVLDVKVKTMQELMKQATTDIQSMKHN
ncbi:MAG: hypothetical protein K0Q53_2054 [Massilibacillus sp.]|jgi:hypothetical protein|nr:hypothetical protein [Massilibacillus sp.]